MSDMQMITTKPRRFVVLFAFALLASVLLGRLVLIQLNEKDFLQSQGDARHIRTVEIPANRGSIFDATGEPLAVSTPVFSVWLNPKSFAPSDEAIGQPSSILEIREKSIKQLIAEKGEKEFVYLKRHVMPDIVDKIKAVNLRGVDFQREYRRYYPAGEVFSHVVGFTDIDDVGQEGLELAYDQWLRGETGLKRVLKDRLGRVIRDIESVKLSRPGNDLKLSINKHIQYLAYRELKAAVLKHGAESGSLVMLDSDTGEVLAMVNQPAYNPNDRGSLNARNLRNRAVTDVYEPGSTVKPFVIASALAEKLFSSSSKVNTSPGYVRVGQHVIKDVKNFGSLNVTDVLVKSSNVGVTKIALAMDARTLWGALTQFGFGSESRIEFPGEGIGRIAHFDRWGDIDQATISFGYGLSATPLQLASAYNVLAQDGKSVPVKLVPTSSEQVDKHVLSSDIASQVKEIGRANV